MQGKVLPEPNAMTPFYAGIDVSKAFLDVHLHPCGETLRVANDRPGLRRLKRRLAGLEGVHVVMEATGAVAAMEQTVDLVASDVVEIEAAGIGILRTPIVAG